jgi:hypothetical protein
MPDGSTQWWKLTDSWHLVKIDPNPDSLATDVEVASAISTHSALPDVHHPANVGLTGTRTVGGYTFTFTNGLLTGFSPA